MLMRKPLDNRVSALFSARLVPSKFACAFIDAMLETTEKEAIEYSSLNTNPHPCGPRAARWPLFLLGRESEGARGSLIGPLVQPLTRSPVALGPYRREVRLRVRGVGEPTGNV